MREVKVGLMSPACSPVNLTARLLVRAQPRPGPDASRLVARPNMVPQEAQRILVVDDEPQVREVLRVYLARAGYDVVQASDGEEAIQVDEAEGPELVILDLMLPRRDGLAVYQKLKARRDVPVVMLTARGEEGDRLLGLDLGADDYIVKPFSPRQLVARAEAVLRRARAALPRGPLTVGEVTLEPGRVRLRRDGETEVPLTRLEGRLLEALILNVPQVVPSDSLIDAVWGPSGGDRSMLKQLVYRLRQKVEPDPSNPTHIRHIPGAGYLFEA